MKKNIYHLDVAIRYPGLKIAQKDFEPLMDRAIKILCGEKHLNSRMCGGQVHVVLTDDENIALLNETYRGKEGPTDVISLSYFDELNFPGEHDLAGEIMISADTAKRQAREHRKTLKQELQFLFVHGLLHVFGYDHERAAERKVMFGLQDQILGTKSWWKIID